ncbi:hypothetical protein GGH18_001218, partial [Coemansia sp. RSA 530]
MPLPQGALKAYPPHPTLLDPLGWVVHPSQMVHPMHLLPEVPVEVVGDVGDMA